MTFRFTVPGQPPSVNHLYKIAIGRTTGADGRQKTYRRMVKTEGVETYQTSVGWIVKSAKPASWSCEGMIRITYWFYLKRDIDCDNAMKALNDAIAKSLGVDDRRFLPCVASKSTGHSKPYVEIEVSCA